MRKLVARFKKDESGATAIEYGLLAALIGVAVIVGAGTLGQTLSSRFDNIAEKVAGPAAGTAKAITN